MRGGWYVAALGLTLLGLGLSIYLTLASLSAAGAAGCGPGSGCAQVLGSDWSSVRGVPVGLFAAVTYLFMLGALLCLRHPAFAVRRIAGLSAVGAAGAILAAAGWFTYLQSVELQTWCMYCVAAHGNGMVLAALVLGAAVRHDGRALLLGLPVGMTLVVVLALVQINTPATVYRLPAPAQGDYDLRDAAGRRVGLLGGQLALDLAHEPMSGNADARYVVALMFDHACPICRRAHKALHAARDRAGDGLALVLLPVPLNPRCHPALPGTMGDHFEESCERSRLLIAVALADRSKVEPFETWMFAGQSHRTATEARAHAETLLGREALDRALADPRVEQAIARNVEAFAAAGADRVPVLLAPHTPPIYGRIDDPDTIDKFLQEARANHPTTAQP